MLVTLSTPVRAVAIDATPARTPEQRAVGFSGRSYIGPDDAIFFSFPRDTMTPFTMANTFVPLDIVFFDAHGTIVGMTENASPRSSDMIAPSTLYRHVLEVPGGWLRSHGVDATYTMRREWFPDPV